MTAINHAIDPTLAALDVLHGQASGSDAPRRYLGASQIGDPCARKLWYGFRHALPRTISASGYRAIKDGYHGEMVMINWLRSLPGIDLWTSDPDAPDSQIGFAAVAGHFRGHVDGVISGLYQAPKTPHVWEMKVCNEAKFNKLVKLIAQHGEKAALLHWDEIYYAQAQIYMQQLELTRHYLTVATPGNRQLVSCRTVYRATDAKALLKKAETIITAERPPLKLSDNPSWYVCKFCDVHALCHGQAMPAVNCRTCAHSTARMDESAPWTCELSQPSIHGDQTGCDHHAYHPDLLANHAQAVNANPKTGVITFKRKDGSEVLNGSTGLKSRDWLAQTAPVPAGPALLEDDVLVELATDSTIPAESLLAGDMDESDWGKLTSAVSQFWDRWKGDEPKLARLRNLIEVIDSAYVGLMDSVEKRRAA